MQNIDRTRVINYFAYGSNMNPERMRQRGVMFYSRQRLVLPGYRLVFNKIISIPNAGAANIVPYENSLVEGVLYKVTIKGIYNLDRYEHYPNEYDRVLIRVPHVDQNFVDMKTYIAHSEKTSDDIRPRREYLEHLLAAGDILTEGYINQLRSIQTLD